MNDYGDIPRSPPVEVINLMHIGNQIILPILIIIGLISNITCLKIVNKPKAKKEFNIHTFTLLGTHNHMDQYFV